MQSYIDHLLSDLRDCHHKQPPPVDYRLLHPQYADVPDELKYVAEWENAPEQSCEALFGIPGEAFPPAERLTEAQMEAVVEGILELWKAWNIYADMPDGVPPPLVYRVLTNFWRDEKITYVSEGDSHLEFCDYDTDSCPWGEAYCRCRHYLEDEDTFLS